MNISVRFVLAGFLVLSTSSASFADSKSTYTRQHHSGKLSQQVAITYAVEVIRDGKVSNVSDSYAFKKGDGVRFHIQSNTDGYMYILASGADGGQYDVWYPVENSVESPLQKGKDYHLPERGVNMKDVGALRSLKLVFSKTKLEREPMRSMNLLPGVEAPPSIQSPTAVGLKSDQKPSSFAGEKSTTVLILDTNKPLGVEVVLGTSKAEQQNSDKVTKPSTSTDKH